MFFGRVKDVSQLVGEPRELGPGSSGTKPGPEFGAELRAEFGAEPGTKPGVEPVAGPDTRVDAVSSERLGLRLRELRLRSGKSLRALARELGISASAVSQIELGTMRPSVSRLIAYVSALGVPLAAVFDTDDAPAVERRLAIRRSGRSTRSSSTVESPSAGCHPRRRRTSSSSSRSIRRARSRTRTASSCATTGTRWARSRGANSPSNWAR